MEGPRSTLDVSLDAEAEPHLVWLRGVRVDVVGEDGVTPLSSEFMCHVNIDLDPAEHRQLFGSSASFGTRLVTLSQGQLTTTFPETFAYPLMSNEPLKVTMQVLNLSRPDIRITAKLKVTVDFIDDYDRVLPYRALFNTAAYAYRALEDPWAAQETKPAEAHHDQTCSLPSASVSAPNSMGASDFTDSNGLKVTGHWTVPPGRQVTISPVNELMNLPFPTTLHYAAVHVHPYCESLELRDETEQRVVFKSRTVRGKRGGALKSVETFSSADDVPMYPNHVYKLVAVYDNPTRENADSMTVMFLSFLNPTFDRTKIAFPEQVTLRTSVGSMQVRLLPHSAPQTVTQFVRLARAGVFDTTWFARFEPGFVAQASAADDRRVPLTPEQRQLIRRIPLENRSKLHHRRGVLSMAHPDGDADGAETSYSILLGEAPHLDNRYTIFGEIEPDDPVLAKIEQAAATPNGRIEILGIELAPAPDHVQ